MNADVIKSFLVSLGFDVDESGQRKFEATLVGATTTALKAGAAIEGAALSVLAFTAKIASGLDNLYWASQRTGSSVEGLKALSYAAVQAGGSADAARNSLEGLSRFMRHNPGAEGFLNRLGVQTRDASGKMRDMSAVFTGVGQQLNKMPQYRANQYAQMLGIDENTLLAMRRGLGQYQGEFTAMAKAIGFNADRAAASSNRFMTSLKSFGEMAGMARDKIGSNLADGLAGSIDRLKKQIVDNFPKIESGITAAVKGILWLAEAVGRVVFRLIQAAGDISSWWKSLDDNSKKLLETLGAVLIAWRLLNAEMWKSPITWVLGLVAALGLLYDDYRTWKERGNSLIDWAKWQPAIDKAKDAITWFRDKLLDLKDSVGGWQKSFEILGTFIAGVWVAKVLGAFGKISGLPIPPWLKLWALYAGYLASDKDNIADSAKSSWNYAKRNIGDGLRTVGIDNDIGRRDKREIREWPAWMDWLHGGPGKVIRPGESNGVVNGDNIQPDIPGAPAVPPVVPTTPHTVKDPQLDDLNRTQEKARQEAAKQREDAKLYPERSGGMLGKIAEGIGRMVDGLFPPAAAAEITPNIVTSDVGHDVSVNGTARGIRNNNPGNLNFAGQAGAQLEGPGGRFARFETAFDGIRAMARQLLRYFDGKTTGTRLQTIRDIISTWAPSKDNNNTEAYINALSKKLGVRPDAVLNLRDPQMLSQLMNGIIHHENGSNPYQRELVSAAVNSAAGRAAEIHQQTVINVHGVNNPREAANLVADKQGAVNARTVQQLKGPA